MVQQLSHRSIFAAIAVAFSLAQIAEAQWTVTNLNPSNSADSRGNAASGNVQVGYIYNSTQKACLWLGTPFSVVVLHPAGAGWSIAYAATNTHQVGIARVGTVERATLWNGTSALKTDLHPTGAAWSRAFAVSGDYQGGVARVNNAQHASLWNGSSGSWSDLNPIGSAESQIYAMSGSQQAGYAFYGDQRAGIWNGTHLSWVNLNPTGSIQSAALATDGVQQGGWARVSNVVRASLWSGSAASWLDLNPAGSTNSAIQAIKGSHQVGYAWIGGKQRAGIWTGSPESWVDLHQYVPATISSSEARGIAVDGDKLYIVGTGFVPATTSPVALLWTHPVRPVSGTIDLPDWNASRAGIPKVIEIRNVGETTPLQSATVKLDASGQYSFLALVPPGTYDITAKGTHWLRRLRGSVAIADAGAAGIDFSLIDGDCDGNNYIGTDDYLILSNAFDLSLGEPGYDARADLNGDGYIGTDDYIILNDNFDVSGD